MLWIWSRISGWHLRMLLSCCLLGSLPATPFVQAVSNALAFGTLPLLLLLWTRGMDLSAVGGHARVPYLEIFYSLLMVVGPVRFFFLCPRLF